MQATRGCRGGPPNPAVKRLDHRFAQDSGGELRPLEDSAGHGESLNMPSNGIRHYTWQLTSSSAQLPHVEEQAACSVLGCR